MTEVVVNWWNGEDVNDCFSCYDDCENSDNIGDADIYGWEDDDHKDYDDNDGNNDSNEMIGFINHDRTFQATETSLKCQ